jgi:hypothetical protein
VIGHRIGMLSEEEKKDGLAQLTKSPMDSFVLLEKKLRREEAESRYWTMMAANWCSFNHV